jgi:TetR/AcrR family transcriptional regulator, lmrAB and yxaGH operons repressor
MKIQARRFAPKENRPAMPRRTDARGKALAAAERLFRERGYAAAGLAEILAVSGAPKGSFYFHFPQGKLQLALEVLEAYGARVEGGVAALGRRHAGDPAALVAALCDNVAEEMRASGWRLGCVVQNIAIEAEASESHLIQACAGVFERWIAAVAEALGPKEYPSHARQRAIRLLAAVQGARGLARATRSREAFDAVKADNF